MKTLFALLMFAAFAATAAIPLPELNWVPGSDWLNVKNFGAKGDGTTDDTAALQKAFDAVQDGTVIYFPPGVYPVSSELVIIKKPPFKGKEKRLLGTGIYGHGRNTVLRWQGKADGTILRDRGMLHCRMIALILTVGAFAGRIEIMTAGISAGGTGSAGVARSDDREIVGEHRIAEGTAVLVWRRLFDSSGVVAAVIAGGAQPVFKSMRGRFATGCTGPAGIARSDDHVEFVFGRHAAERAAVTVAAPGYDGSGVIAAVVANPAFACGVKPVRFLFAPAVGTAETVVPGADQGFRM